MKIVVLFLLLLWCPSLSHAQDIVKMEYWVDNDPGFGAATNISGFTAASNITAYSFSLPANTAPGLHTIGVRSRDARNVWSHTRIFPVLVSASPNKASITKIEYFVDVDPGIDVSTPVTTAFDPQPDVANFVFPLSSGLSQGIHTIGIRSKNADNVWSMTNYFPVYVADSSHGVMTSLEYFWDADPGVGNATDTIFDLPVADLSTNIRFIRVPLDIGLGSHTLFIRSKESRNRWSHTNYAHNIQVTGTVDVQELAQQTGVQVYPNPFSRVLTVKSDSKQTVRYLVYDARGRVVLDTVVTGEAEFDTKDLSSGVYTLFVWSDQQKIYTCRLVKQ